MTPYTYLIVFTHPITHDKEYYYGVQYGKKAHPDNLWNTYFTSSKAVKHRRKVYGDNCFSYEVRKVFDSASKAKLWEQRVLKKMRVLEKAEWLNENDRYAPPCMEGETNPFYGRNHTKETRKKLSEKAKKNYADKEYYQRFVETKNNQSYDFMRTPEYRKMKSELSRKMYHEGKTGLTDNKGTNNGMFGKSHSAETKELFRQQRKGKLSGEKNPMYGKTHSDEVKKLLSEKFKGTKQSPETIEKKRQALLGKIWINNGLITKKVSPEDAAILLEQGWHRGRAMDKRAGKKYILDKFFTE